MKPDKSGRSPVEEQTKVGAQSVPKPPISNPARPSPFALDRAKKAGRPEPQSIGATALAPESVPAPAGVIDWREKLHAALIELDMPFTADAVEHSTVNEAGNTLQFVTPKDFMLALRAEDISRALQHIGARAFRINVTSGEVARPAAAASVQEQKPDDVSRRALENPERHASLRRGAWEAAREFTVDRHMRVLEPILCRVAGTGSRLRTEK